MRKSMKSTLAMLAVLSVCGTGTIFAADAPVYALKGITVTATRQAESLQDVPANVQVITEKDIRSRNVQTASDAVAMATGVSASNSVEGTVNLRGYNSKNILVLVDGQQMNTAWNGDVDWNMIPVDNIRKIEVVSGGQSALYGGRAVGGVINIMTKTQKQNGVHGNALVSYGSHNTWKQAYSVSGKKDKVTWGTFYESKSTDGWNDYTPAAVSGASKDGNHIISNEIDARGNKLMGNRGSKSVMSENYGFNLGYDFNDTQRLTYKYAHANYTWKYNNPTSWVEKDGKVSWPAIDFTDSSMSSFYGTKGWRAYDMHSLTYNDQKNKVHAHFGLTNYTKDGYTQPGAAKETLDSNFDGSGKKSSYPSKSWDFDVNKRWNWGDHTVLLGGSYGQDKFSQVVLNDISDWKSWDSTYTKNSKDQCLGGKDKNWALYVQDKWNFASKWNAYIGGRYDHYKKYDGYSQYVDKDTKNFGEASYNKFSPKLSLDYAVNSDTNVYLSYGRSFNPPILYQVYRYTEKGSIYEPNPSLAPEITDTWELGVKAKVAKKTEVNAGFFQAKTKDYINYTTLENGHKQYQNLGDSKTHGFEISVNHHHSDDWTSYVNYTWQTGTISENGQSEFKNYDIPRHLLHLGTTYNKDAWTVNLDGMFISNRGLETDDMKKYADTYQSGHFRSRDAYFLLNLNTNYQFTKNFSMQFSIENLLDREYYDEDISTSHYYIGDGRTFTLSARYTF